MNFDLSEEQVALREAIRRFIGEQYPFEVQRKRASSASSTDLSVWRQLGEMGWLGILVPDSCGGLGLSLAEALLVLQEFGRGLLSEPYLEGAVLAPQLLLRAGTAFARDRLQMIASGEHLVTVALLEADRRYRLEPPRTLLARAAKEYRLTGSKILVEGGDVAHAFLVLASLEGSSALVYVPADAPGVSRGSYRLLDGGWASDVSFDSVPVAETALLSSGVPLHDQLSLSLDEAALGAAALSIGCMDRILELSAEYLAARKQFGRPLASFQVLQHRVVDLFIEIEMARSAFFGAVAVLAKPASERSAAVSAGRVRTDQAALKVGTQGIHLHGGIGMAVEYPVGHYYRRLVRLTRRYGDTEHHLERYERLEVERA